MKKIIKKNIDKLYCAEQYACSCGCTRPSMCTCKSVLSHDSIYNDTCIDTSNDLRDNPDNTIIIY